MKTQARTLKIEKEVEGLETFYATNGLGDKPKTGDGDVIVDPKKDNDPKKEGEEEEGQERPQTFLGL